MKERIKITLIIGGIILLIIGTVSASYAFFSITKKQDIANIFNSGCLNISIENESNAITLDKTYPITDVEGLDTVGYTFTIKNTCNTSTNYMINLESLDQVVNTLDTRYIKTSLSSDTMDNLIQKLDSNLVTIAYINNAYISHNLYKGTISGNTTKTFNLKLWMDYDTTTEQGTNKTYASKINVIANPDLEVPNTPEIKTTLVDNTLEGTIVGSATYAKYCSSNDNVCIPDTSVNISNNKISIELDRNQDQIVCINLNNGKTTCSNKIEKLLPITVEDIIASSNYKEQTDTVPDFSKIADADEGVYQTSDGMYGGKTYYWRGAVTNNYVKFANKCWRIIRINGDKSIRLIYDGRTCQVNGTSTIANIAVTSQAYKTSYNQSYYVGWTQNGTQRTNSTTATASNAKTQIEKWYSANIGSTYTSKIADGKFCNDRNVGQPLSNWSGSWSTLWSANGTKFAYAGIDRLFNKYIPTFSCPSDDVYTLKVGLITADEVEFAGGGRTTNTLYYLYNGMCYWTMTPARWDGTYAEVFFVSPVNSFSINRVHNTYGLRPVINLKSDVTFSSGNGTLDNPYIVAN